MQHNFINCILPDNQNMTVKFKHNLDRAAPTPLCGFVHQANYEFLTATQPNLKRTFACGEKQPLSFQNNMLGTNKLT
jgi:hypothetical protein